jgi:hypothetical protein
LGVGVISGGEDETVITVAEVGKDEVTDGSDELQATRRTAM